MSKGWKIDSEQQSVNARARDYLCIHADGRRATVCISDSVRVGYMGDVNAMIFDIANKISPPRPAPDWSIVACTFVAERNQYEVTARKGDHECWLRLNRQQIGHGTLTESQLPTLVQARANYAMGRRPHVPEEYGDGTRHNLRSALICLRAGDADAIIVPLGFSVDPWCCLACAGSVRECMVCGKESTGTEYRIDYTTPLNPDARRKAMDKIRGVLPSITDGWISGPGNRKHASGGGVREPLKTLGLPDRDTMHDIEIERLREEGRAILSKVVDYDNKRPTAASVLHDQIKALEQGPGIINVVGIPQRVPVSVGYDDMSGDDIAADWRRG